VANATSLAQEMIHDLLQAQVSLELKLGRRSTMYPLTRFLLFAATSAVALSMASIPARADEFAQNLGPVGPNEPILTTVGSKRIIAFYELDKGRCAVNAVIFEKTDADTGMTTAARVRVSLSPHARWFISTAPITSRSIFSAATARRRLASSTPASLLPLGPLNKPHSIGVSAHATIKGIAPQIHA
jgi:hypothetical protein